MNTKIKILAFASILIAGIAFTSCNNTSSKHVEKEEKDDHDHDEATEGMAVLSAIQRDAIHLKVGEMPHRQMSGIVKTTGQLEVAPNNKAEVTTYIGGNVVSISAFQGDKVKRGQVLATLEHPDIIQLQQDFIERYNNLQYLQKEYKRQEELYRNNVGSGKNFQRVEAEYKSAKAQYQGLKLRLDMLKLNTKHIEAGNIIHQLKVLSPIAGYVSEINISLGSYIDARTKMFSIRNFDKIHADLSVYEKDINKIKKGQDVRLYVANMPNKELRGKIFAIAKEYKTDSRSIVVHASIENPCKKLIADSYVSGEILTNQKMVAAVPENAIVTDAGKQFIFVFDVKGSKAANHSEADHKDGEEHKDGDEHKDDDHDHKAGDEHKDDDHDHKAGDEHKDDNHDHKAGDEHKDDDHDHKAGDEHKDDDHDHKAGDEHKDDNHDHKAGDVHKQKGKSHRHDIEDYKELKNQKIAYRMVEVIVGISSKGYKAITPTEKLPHDAVVVLDGAYYLLSDLKKSEAAHQH